MKGDIWSIFGAFGVDMPLSDIPRCRAPRDRLASISTLEELIDEALQVECDLKQYATNLVFGEGDEHADIVVMGEAPGADEDLQGRPFVGQSGRLLIKALRAIGFEREDLYITNTVPWRPVMNRTPTQSEVDLFMPIKRRQLAIIRPKIILCVGSISAKAITGENSGIMKMRGRWFKYDEDTLVLCTFHPAYLLRSPTQKKYFWQDLVKLKIKYLEICSR